MNPHASDWYRADLAWMHYLGRDYDQALWRRSITCLTRTPTPG